MKFVFFIGILAAFSGATKAMSLGDAIRELIAEFNIAFFAMISDWNNNALFDTESCQTVHSLLRDFPAAWTVIREHEGYQRLLTTISEAGVAAEWDTFVRNSLQPAFGFITALQSHNCAGTRGGNHQLVLDIRATFASRRPHIDDTLDRLQAQSPDFLALMGRIAAEQALFNEIRCTPELRAIDTIYRNAGFEVDEVAQMIGDVFGWTVVPCP
ncbi:hypothetical protein PVAND_007458 [Polypedilum vanderplanki]|uniref:Uncharacterized protein n=1 Tax=Polypedilum vanderplanki TaxID=319348 RepID=A0A9J6C6Z4_POLVA|nr:hypothetical protein PVAND_007458 [Polypedilum vanderplanki]